LLLIKIGDTIMPANLKAPATAIKVGKSRLGIEFERVKQHIPDAVSVEYLHISTSVSLAKAGSVTQQQLLAYGQLLEEFKKQLENIKEVSTGNIHVTDNGEILLAVESEQLSLAVAKLEEGMRQIGLGPADKAKKLHITLKKGSFGDKKPSADEVRKLRDDVDQKLGSLKGLERAILPLDGAEFGAIDYSNQINPPIIEGWPTHTFSTPTAVKAASAVSSASSVDVPEVAKKPIPPFELDKSRQITITVENMGDYYKVSYSTKAEARIYPDGRLTNGDGTKDLPQVSPLRLQIDAVRAHFGITSTDKQHDIATTVRDFKSSISAAKAASQEPKLYMPPPDAKVFLERDGGLIVTFADSKRAQEFSKELFGKNGIKGRTGNEKFVSDFVGDGTFGVILTKENLACLSTNMASVSDEDVKKIVDENCKRPKMGF